MYPQQAPAYPTYLPAAPAGAYYAPPAHAYPHPQMHVNPMPPVQQPTQSAAQAAMMASIKVCISHASTPSTQCRRFVDNITTI